MNIRSALDNLIVIQAALSITSPDSISIDRAYKFFPDRDSALPDTPCFINSWSLTGEDRRVSLRDARFTVHMQLFIDDADLDVGADIASAFLEAIMDALDADVSLGGTVTNTDLRGGDPTLGLLDWAGQGYVGLNLFLDLQMMEPKSFS